MTFLGSALPTLLSWAAASALLILAVMAVRLFLRERLSARVRYALWAVVLIRLLIPFQLGLPLPLGAADLVPAVEDTALYAFPTHRQEMPETYTQSILEAQGESPLMSTSVTERYFPRLGGLELDYYTGAAVLEGDGITDYAFFTTLPRLLTILWAAGAGVMALVLLAFNLRFARRLKKRRRALDIPDCPLPVYQAEGLPSPCLFGLFRPAVYLTPEAAALPPEQLGHVLAHELTHHAHLDHIWAAARCLCLALHWYNPLVWLAAILSKEDGELACDEGAVGRLGEGARIPYGRTLVGLVARAPRPGDLLQCSTAMTGGKKNIQQRIALLLKKPQTKTAALFAAVALVALAAVFVFGGGTGGTPSGGPFPTFRDQVSSAQAVRFGMPPHFSFAFPDPITDEDLLKQAKGLLGQGRDLLTPEELDRSGVSQAAMTSHSLLLSDHPDQEDSWNRYLLYTQDGKTYALTPANLEAEERGVAAVFDFDLVSRLEALARQQNEHGEFAGGRTSPAVTRYQIDDPDYIARLSALFLADEETVALNESPDGELADWLSNWTHSYIVEYAVPYWVDAGQAGWYAKAIDAGSWYSIQIPDHMVEPVLSLCQEALEKEANPLRGVLLGTSSLISVQSGTPLTIQQLREEVTDDESLSVWPVRFAVVDMDQDGTTEIALQLSVSDHENAFYELLHVQDGQVYGYLIPYRGLQSLKTDGTYGYNSGLADSCGYCTARFTTQELADDRFLYYEYDSATNSATYYADGAVVTERQYLALEEAQREKPDVTWHDFTLGNIRAFFP